MLYEGNTLSQLPAIAATAFLESMGAYSSVFFGACFDCLEGGFLLTLLLRQPGIGLVWYALCVLSLVCA